MFTEWYMQKSAPGIPAKGISFATHYNAPPASEHYGYGDNADKDLEPRVLDEAEQQLLSSGLRIPAKTDIDAINDGLLGYLTGK